MEAIAWGFVLRVLQAAIQCSPFLFTGLCVMAIFHRLMGQARTRWLFGSNSVSSLFQSWLIGMLLPGCSLGTIPIVKQLRRSGIAVGSIFAFALSSPLFDPLSLLYGLTLSKPFTIVAFAACSLVVVTVSGMIFDRVFPQETLPEAEPPETPHGYRRLIAVLVVMARETVSSTAGLVLMGLLGAGVLGLILPPGSLQRSMNADNPFSPVLMTLLAIPAYATPMVAMSQLGSMFQHGNSVGAAFTLLIFGAGLNLGLLAWMVLNYGWKKSLFWMGLMLAVVLLLSYGIERPLYPTDIEPADHTHAFDNYCQPFGSDFRATGGFPAEIWRRLRMETQPHEVAGLILMVFLVSLGWGLTFLDRYWVIETWLNRPLPPVVRSRWDIVVPGPVLAAVGLLAIVGFSITGCYAYYPDPRECLEELNLARTEALGAALSGNHEHALHWIPICESWNRRLQVGTYLRQATLSDYHRAKARALADQLENLEHMLENGDSEDAIRKYVSRVSRTFGRLATAYRDELN